ncbi:MAG: ShlB/FhaC/HecB family hemolysin secretion/activation protein [Burkholderiaceae bacterium]|nr:ShlB/FhaC/HecB family hemolysin secretion/activation protein [Burkholderiaceae bacterium]
MQGQLHEAHRRRGRPPAARASRAVGWLLVAGLLAPAAAARAQAPIATAASAPPLDSVVVLGGAGLAPSAIQASVRQLIGQPADAALLARVRQAVGQAHDMAGLGLVAVDAPLLQGGTALVRVHALRLAQVTLERSDAAGPEAALADAALARATLPALRSGLSPDLGEVDRQLRLANLQPHRRWSVDFRAADGVPPAPAVPAAPAFSITPGQTVAGGQDTPVATPPVARPRAGTVPEVEARVRVSGASPIYGRAMLDNAGQEATGRERARVQLGHGDLFGPGRSLDLTALVSVEHPGRQQQLALRYQHPVPSWATLFSLEWSKARSRPGLVSGFFDVSGQSDSLTLSARHLLARRGALEPYVDVALERSVNDDVVDFFGVNLGSKVGAAPLSLALGATWQNGAWSAFGQARLRHNLGGPNASDARYAGARFGATPGWTTLDLAGEARRALPGGHEWVLRGQVQLSDDALVSPQQFRAGGSSMLRGLREGEMAGDQGVAVALEYWRAVAAGHRVGLLLDAATVRRNQALPGEPASADATTMGLGWQWQARPGVRVSAAAAHVLTARRLPQTRPGDSRLHLLLDWAF